MDKAKRLQEILAELESMYLTDNRKFDPRAITLEESSILAGISRVSGRLASSTAKKAINRGDVIVVKWTDGWYYPLIARQVNTSKVDAHFIYENGKDELYTIPITNIVTSFTGSPKEKIEQLEAYIATNDRACNFENQEIALEQIRIKSI